MEESKEKIEKTVSPLTTDSVKGISRIGTSSVGGGDMSTMDEVLGQIFVILKRIDTFDKLQNKKQLLDLQISNLEEIDRNQKLIKALRGKPRRPKRKAPKEEQQQKEVDKAKTEQPATAKPTVPEAPKPPTAKPAPTKPPEVTKPAAPVKPVEPTKPPAPAPQPAPTAAPVKPAPTQPAAPTTAPVKPAAPKPSTAAKVAVGAAAAGMSLSDVQAMIMKHEGKINYPYKDSVGLWTIGVGHLIQPGNGKTLPPEYDAYKNNGGPYDKKNNKTPAMTDEQILKLFNEDFEHHKKMAMATPGWNLANETGQAAMIDLAFNMGGGWYKKFPNTSKALAAGDFNKASEGLKDSAWYTQVKDRGVKIVDMIRNGKKTDINSTPETNIPPSGGRIEQGSKENRDLKADAAKQESPPTQINNNTYNTQQSSTPPEGGSSDDTNPYTRKQRG
jgi:GH24 family phage-related lysozyme (muramidase)